MMSIELFVKDALADELQKDGFAEIVCRRADAKFREMIKCKLLTSSKSDRSSLEKISAKALGLDVKASDMLDIRKSINSINANSRDMKNALEKIPSSIKNIVTRMDGVYQGIDALKELSYMNIALSMVTLAVDVAGFMIVSDKLGLMTDSLSEISETVENIAVVQINEKLKELDKLIMDYNELASAIQDGDYIKLEIIAEWLKHAKTYISEMLSNFSSNAINVDILLRIICTLMPLYSIMLSFYFKQYYFEKNKRSPNYELYLGVFDTIMKISLDKRMIDYYFLEKNYSLMDATNITESQLLLSLNAKILIEDQQVLLEKLKTKEAFETFEKRIESIVDRRVVEVIQEFSEDTEITQEECI